VQISRTFYLDRCKVEGIPRPFFGSWDVKFLVLVVQKNMYILLTCLGKIFLVLSWCIVLNQNQLAFLWLCDFVKERRNVPTFASRQNRPI
jgi:hypothetical protein